MRRCSASSCSRMVGGHDLAAVIRARWAWRIAAMAGPRRCSAEISKSAAILDCSGVGPKTIATLTPLASMMAFAANLKGRENQSGWFCGARRRLAPEPASLEGEGGSSGGIKGGVYLSRLSGGMKSDPTAANRSRSSADAIKDRPRKTP